MRAIVQRVSQSRVVVEGRTTGEIGLGILALVGVSKEDDESNALALARKVVGLRIFNDDQGKMNLDLAAVGGEILAVSNFTLYGDTSRGRRPGFDRAAGYEQGERLFNLFCQACTELGAHVDRGVYGADMQVELVNSGPVTLIVEG